MKLQFYEFRMTARGSALALDVSLSRTRRSSVYTNVVNVVPPSSWSLSLQNLLAQILSDREL